MTEQGRKLQYEQARRPNSQPLVQLNWALHHIVLTPVGSVLAARGIT